MAAIVRSSDGDLLPEAEAAREWDERFSALRLKRAGPSVLGAESWLPAAGLAAYARDVERLGAAQRLPIATYGTVIGPDLLTVMSMFPCDETRTARYLLDLSLTRALFATAARHGGRPYGTGVWNTPYLRRSYSGAQLAERQARKQRFDPHGVLNPGKGYAPPLLLQPALFHPAMAVLAAVRRVAGGAS